MRAWSQDFIRDAGVRAGIELVGIGEKWLATNSTYMHR